MDDAFRKLFDVNHAELREFMQISCYTPAQTLSMADFILKSSDSPSLLDPAYIGPLFAFREEVLRILSKSEAQYQDDSIARGLKPILSKFAAYTPAEAEGLLQFHKEHGHLPLFKMLIDKLATSNIRNEQFYCAYIGLNEPAKTKTELAQLADLTRERIRQIVAKAESKIAGRYGRIFRDAYLETFNNEATTFDDKFAVIRETELKQSAEVSADTFFSLCVLLALVHKPQEPKQQKMLPKPKTEQPKADPPKPKWEGYCRLQIKTPSGEYIEEGNSNTTFVRFVREVGWQRVEKLGITYKDRPIISSTKETGWEKALDSGVFLCCRMTCPDKIEIIKTICSHFSLEYEPSMTEPL